MREVGGGGDDSDSSWRVLPAQQRVELDEARLWLTYTMLTDLESMLRSLKNKLGLRPVFLSKEVRSNGQLFITGSSVLVLAGCASEIERSGDKRFLDTLERDAIRSGSRDFQPALHGWLNNTCQQKLSRKSHVAGIYPVLGINPTPGGTKKLIG